MHSLHEGVSVVLYDNCDQCAYQAINLYELDEPSLKRLASAAEGLKTEGLSGYDLSANDHRAVSQLRLMARVVFKSGIAEWVAR